MSGLQDQEAGEDPDLNEAIRIVLEYSGFEVDDLEAIKLVEWALRKKIDTIAENAHFYAGRQGCEPNLLQLRQLKPALADANIQIDRTDFLVEQPQSKSTIQRKFSK
jgi:hypothetical protein